MSASVLFVFHGVNTPSSFYSQIENGKVMTGSDVIRAVPSGHFHTMFTAVKSQKPVIEFTTPQIATLLGEVGMTGASTAAGNVDLYEKKASHLGTRVAATTTAHNRYRCAQTLFYCASISAPHQGIATAQARMIVAWDGTNEPIVPAGSVALAGTPSAAQHFGAGPVEIGGTALNGVQQVDVDFGIRFIEAGGESDIWDTFVAVAEIIPIFRIQTLTTTAFSAYGLDGTAISGDGVEIWLRKKNADGTNVPNGTAEHIKWTVSNGLIVPDDTAGGANNPNTTTLVVYPRADSATGDSVTLDTTAAIA